MAANPTLIGTNLFNRYGKEAFKRILFYYNDQADRGRETNREAEPRVKARLSSNEGARGPFNACS